MQITSLPATSTLGANDVLACEINGVTYKITGSVLASMLQTLGNTLAVSKGGTGLTASPSLQVNLASSSATNILQASPRPGVTGKLAIANGGTNGATAAEARSNLDVYSKSDVDNKFVATNNAGLTAGENTTINSQRMFSLGDLRIYQIVFTADALIPTYTALVNGLPDSGNNYTGMPTVLALNNSNGTTRILYKSRDTLLCSQQIPQGEQLRCTLVYIL